MAFMAARIRGPSPALAAFKAAVTFWASLEYEAAGSG
jgi:hypothetical protein